jgi:hypothetical protein
MTSKPSNKSSMMTKRPVSCLFVALVPGKEQKVKAGEIVRGKNRFISSGFAPYFFVASTLRRMDIVEWTGA